MAIVLTSVTVSASGLHVTPVWETGTTWGALSIQAGKFAYVDVLGERYRLTAKVSQVDNGGEGTNATVVLTASSAIPAGDATFTADEGFMRDTFSADTPEAVAEAVTNDSVVLHLLRARSCDMRRRGAA